MKKVTESQCRKAYKKGKKDSAKPFTDESADESPEHPVLNEYYNRGYDGLPFRITDFVAKR